jgi:hypothetical protein
MTDLNEYLKLSAMARREWFGSVKTKYRSFEELVWKEGENFEGSASPADIEQGPAKMCFHNTFRLVFRRLDLEYVEGFAVSGWAGGIIAVHHAWAVDESGKVVDPTWDEPELAVYRGIRFPREYVAKVALKSGVSGLFYIEEAAELLDGLEVVDR